MDLEVEEAGLFYALCDDCFAICSGSPAITVAEGIEMTTINKISAREEATSTKTSASSLESVASTVGVTPIKSDGAEIVSRSAKLQVV